MGRRQNLWVIGSLLFSLLAVISLGDALQAAEQYPVKPIIYIIPTEAGAGLDILARPVCQKLSTLLGQSVMVVNKPGGGASIAYREVYGSKPDGYTIGAAAPPLVMLKLQGLMPYDYRDYTVMGGYAMLSPIIFASTKTQRPFKTIQEAISFAKSHPGEVSIATSSVGNAWWVATMLFQDATGLKFNIIPQAGTGAFSTAQVAGGHADLGVGDLPSAKSQIDAGNARLLAIIGPKRITGYDQVPTLKEIGYEASIESIHMAIGPPKIPKSITDKLAKAIEVAANDPEYQKFVIERSSSPLYLPPEPLIKTLDGQRELFRKVMDKAGILKEK